MKRHIDARIAFTIVGAVLALGAPIGWYVMSNLVTPRPVDALLYTYLMVSTLIVFASFGGVLGHFFERIRALAVSDPLTGLLNQTSFRQMADVLIEIAIRHKERLAVVMIDIDHFKRVNDQYSHLLGSQAIKEIGTIIKSQVRASDLVARYGGDEFIALLPRTTGAEAKVVAERIRSVVEHSTFRHGSDSVQVTLSFGVGCRALPSVGASRLDDIIALADRALYVAKERGRNRVELVDVMPKEDGGCCDSTPTREASQPSHHPVREAGPASSASQLGETSA